jgi:hypothetical protein
MTSWQYQSIHISDQTLVQTGACRPRLGSYIVEFSADFVCIEILDMSLFEGQSVHTRMTHQLGYAGVLCKLAQAKKVGQLQAQPARSKIWQVHAANFFYSPPFAIQDICIIQNAYICSVSIAQEYKTSFVCFCLLLLPMTMATKI